MGIHFCEGFWFWSPVPDLAGPAIENCLAELSCASLGFAEKGFARCFHVLGDCLAVGETSWAPMEMAAMVLEDGADFGVKTMHKGAFDPPFLDEKCVPLENPNYDDGLELRGHIPFEIPNHSSVLSPLQLIDADAEPLGERLTSVEVLLDFVQLVKQCFGAVLTEVGVCWSANPVPTVPVRA